MKTIDNFLNRITMYRLTLYYLIFLIVMAIILSFLKILSYNPLDITISVFAAVIAGFVSNYIFAKFFNAVPNVESVYITALILALIVPVKYPLSLPYIIAASVVAMASKYLLTIDKRHIFNPAAVSVAAIALLSPEHSATWWVGTPVMLPFVFFGGLLIVRKMQREDMIFNFLSLYLVVIAAGSFIRGGNLTSVISLWRLNVLDSALFFFTFVMFTEPLTSPNTRQKRNYFAYLVAFLYATPSLRLTYTFTPELALVLGNVFSYIISPTSRMVLYLRQRIQLSRDTFEFIFDKDPGFAFIPGQYLEWTLAHKNEDSRGNRRYFSISSSPTENKLSMIVKFYSPPSSYKKELISLNQGGKIIASQVSGDFVLPKDLKKPLVFIAGGVGIAPFRSMIQYIVDRNMRVDIVLIFANRTREDIIYSDLFERARLNGVKSIFVLTDTSRIPSDWQGVGGHITEQNIKQIVPDSPNRIFYISGPQLMVENFKSTLRNAGVENNRIITDFFPGYSES